ncbi:ATP-dependent zinc metalloprotease FtsH [Methanimicrococcus stummii]|uniref:ATP-dependent zinc metalloprotease FtsH n=1 Tax=Methanimicrococcus stummii TaxID=3028294 RepID=A0AA96ZYL0_9EURY|nr:ATP-binding protein [Methanimicrococcus sp. Es2]WNY28941.1 ATP-dependent zinc metalloprotease FtsH [Methanimicrococcus sp. Es2]
MASSETLDVIELLLTAEIYNDYKNELIVNNIPPKIRRTLWNAKTRDVPTPIKPSKSMIKKMFDIDNVEDALKVNGKPFAYVALDEYSGSAHITEGSLDSAAEWFKKQDGARDRIFENSVLAYYYDNVADENDVGVSYNDVASKTPPKEASREWIESIMDELSEGKDNGRKWLDLAYIKAPEEIRESMDELILTERQKNELQKIELTIKNKDHFKNIGLYDIGKVLFVGPPGTGKTSFARALSKNLSIPIIEVRLSMITDQYLGETSKNIDRVFDLAKKFDPCIMFIDEFDFIATSRTANNEHSAIKQAVNTLLKAIDNTSLVEDGVLLIAATNHTKKLDGAVWRRFDEIVDFERPTMDMRKDILDTILRKIEGDINTEAIAKTTEDYTGSDLRMVVREAVLSALLDNRYNLVQEDLEKAVKSFDRRSGLKMTAFIDE